MYPPAPVVQQQAQPVIIPQPDPAPVVQIEEQPQVVVIHHVLPDHGVWEKLRAAVNRGLEPLRRFGRCLFECVQRPRRRALHVVLELDNPRLEAALAARADRVNPARREEARARVLAFQER